MLIFRGLGMGMLFIPITTLSLSTLKGQQIGQGAAFTGMMRQLGGSFGIATITTYLGRRMESHRSDLVAYIDPNNPAIQQRINGLQAKFMSTGKSANEALQMAYKALDGQVMKQSSVLSYMDAFLALGVLFLICIPFVLFVRARKTKEKIDLSEAMH
jgi:DHA2 family multidrug resistance protein